MAIPPPQNDLNKPVWADKKSRTQAVMEERYWDRQNKIQGQKLQNELKILKCHGLIVSSMMIFFTILFVLILFTWVWHLITPPEWDWLKSDQLSKIQSIIFSSSLGAIVTGYIQKYIVDKF